MNDINNDGYTDGSVFHSSDSSVYSGTDADDGHYFKKGSGMAKVVYRNSHENRDFPEGDPRHGTGLNFCKWITSEQPGTAEHFSFILMRLLKAVLNRMLLWDCIPIMIRKNTTTFLKAVSLWNVVMRMVPFTERNLRQEICIESPWA